MNACHKSIGWADYTWNPVTGCLHGCPYCYAAIIAKRFGKTKLARAFKPQYHSGRMAEPGKRKKPADIFVGSACDLWGSWVPDAWIQAALCAMHRADWHRFYCLTKNPARYGGWDLPVGVWRGFTAENQENYNTRLAYLPGRNENFVSLEPLQGPVRIGKDDRVDWVIVGGETGNRKGRVIVPADWIAQVVDDCRAKGIPVYVKGQVPGNWPKEKPS